MSALPSNSIRSGATGLGGHRHGYGRVRFHIQCELHLFADQQRPQLQHMVPGEAPASMLAASIVASIDLRVSSSAVWIVPLTLLNCPRKLEMAMCFTANCRLAWFGSIVHSTVLWLPFTLCFG